MLPMGLALWLFTRRVRALKVIVGICLCLAITDNFNARVLKPFFGRQRPPRVMQDVQLRTEDHYGLSFPSNHAANTFAVATFLTLVYPWTFFAFFPLAFLVAFSRVYVGVHFPLDVFFGALLGVAIAHLFYRLWRKAFKYYIGLHKE